MPHTAAPVPQPSGCKHCPAAQPCLHAGAHLGHRAGGGCSAAVAVASEGFGGGGGGGWAARLCPPHHFHCRQPWRPAVTTAAEDTGCVGLTLAGEKVVRLRAGQPWADPGVTITRDTDDDDQAVGVLGSQSTAQVQVQCGLLCGGVLATRRWLLPAALSGVWWSRMIPAAAPHCT